MGNSSRLEPGRLSKSGGSMPERQSTCHSLCHLAGAANMRTEMRSFYNTTTPHISHASSTVDGILSKYSSVMSSKAYSPAMTRSSRPNPFHRLVNRVQLEYYRYEVTFGLYVMTPSEKCVANTFVLIFVTLVLWALLLCFPSLLWDKLSRLVWLLTGRNGQEMGIALGIPKQYGNAIPRLSAAENALSS